MAIQMRRGNKADFDPTKMLPGEWAVSIDSDTTRQWVWMCFAPGVVKRMAAFEDIEWVLSDEFAKSSVICDVELDSTATKAYAVGDFLMLHGHLYQVTAAIAIGDTITEGTNVTETTVMATIDGKVDKEAGKGLSTEDYTSAEKTKLGALPDVTSLQTSLDGKVDKVEGKGLSTEDYTTTEKTKLAGLPTGTDLADDLSDLNQAISDLDSSAVKSVNGKTPTSGAVTVIAEDIPADGIGDETVSGNPIVIEDAMSANARGLKVTLEPVQDLHGFDKPWVGGAGKNKLPFPFKETSKTQNGLTITVNSDNTLTVSGTASATTDFVLFGQYGSTADVLPTETYIVSLGTSFTNVEIHSGYNTSGYTIIAGNSGTINATNGISYLIIRFKSGFTVPSATKIYPMLRLSTESDSSFAPYSNICPISGWDEVSAKRTRKNFATTAIYKQDYVLAKDGAENPAFGFCITDKIPVTPNTTYAISYKKGTESDTDAMRVGLFTSSGIFIERLLKVYGQNFTTPANVAFVRLSYCNNSNDVGYKYDVQLEIGQFSSSYEPYSGQTATVTLPQTVYGGDVDFSGKVRVTKAFYEFDGSNDEAWDKTNSGTGSWFYVMFYLQPAVQTDAQISNLYVKNTVYLGNTNKGFFVTTDGDLRIRENTEDTLQNFRAKLASNPLQICYELVTPIELTLTPTQLTLLEGTNILTADGTINLTYLGSMASNVQAEIDEFESATNNIRASIAFVENTTAKTSHAVGDYIILNDMLCKVIAGISTGETITIGTNVQTTTLAAELRAIWAEISA